MVYSIIGKFGKDFHLQLKHKGHVSTGSGRTIGEAKIDALERWLLEFGK